MELRERLENLDEDTLLDIAETAILRRRAVVSHNLNDEQVRRGVAGPGALEHTSRQLADIDLRYNAALDVAEKQFDVEDATAAAAEPVQTSAVDEPPTPPAQGSPEDLQNRADKILGNS